MLDLVSKAVVIRDLVAYQHECFSTIGHEETFNAINHIIKRVMDTPTVGATPVVHGKWIPVEVSSGRDSWRCSICGRRARGKIENLPFCHCGAKMDEVME